MGFITDDDRAQLRGAEETLPRTPLPLQMVSSDEFMPSAQTAKQHEVGERLNAIAEEMAPRLGLTRRRFLQTASGMAAGFVAMNEAYGDVFAANRTEATTPELADTRAASLKDQFIIDVHTHFLRDDIQFKGEFPLRTLTLVNGWNPQLKGEQTVEMVKFDNYYKEVYLDSDTKIALISSSPLDNPANVGLTNEQMVAARAKVNSAAGSRRMMSHIIFTPGRPGWLDDLDAGLALKPDSVKGYTIGENNGTGNSRWPWRLDDKETYKGYEKMVAAGIKNVCVHKGLFPASMDRIAPNLRGYVDASDVGQAAKDWPQLNFIIYHSAYRHVGDVKDADVGMAEFTRTGRLAWTSDLADIPAQYGVNNVYGDLGQVFAMTMIEQPRLCAAIMGTLIKGLGIDRVCWGTDAVWTGSPQWQIEGLRRLEIPEDMRKRHGFAPLGAADGPVKTAVFTTNSARLYNIDATAREIIRKDGLTRQKLAYEAEGPDPSNLRYGYVRV